MNERHYIIYRKIKATFRSVAFFLCRIFPIDKSLVSVCTFEGKGGFGCNPKYIVQELHKERPDLKFVWLVNRVAEHEFPDYIMEVPNREKVDAVYIASPNETHYDYAKKAIEAGKHVLAKKSITAATAIINSRQKNPL